MYALLLAYNADESAVLRLTLQRAGFASRISTDLNQSIQDWEINTFGFDFVSLQGRYTNQSNKGIALDNRSSNRCN